MKRNCLILTVLVVSCILLLGIGCQEEVKVAAAPKTVPAAAPKTVPVERKQVIAPPAPKHDKGTLETPPTKAQTTKPEPNKPSPKITFEKVVHNFGEIGPGTKNPCEFKFTNTGDALLKIKRVQATCGCTAAELTKRKYAPGESGSLKVTYKAGRQGGKTSKRVYVFSNDTAKPKVALTIKGMIGMKVLHKPERLKLSLKAENGGCPAITLTSIDNQPFAVRSFRSPRNCITAAFDSSKRATKVVLKPRVDVEKLKKNLNGRITIGLTHPKCNMVTVPFNTLARFKITPPSLITRDAKPEKPIKKELWILNNYDEDFEVESASSKNGIVKVLSQQKVGKRYKFELEITPPAAEDKTTVLTFTDVFYVNIKGGEELKINCRGFYSRNKKSR